MLNGCSIRLFEKSDIEALYQAWHQMDEMKNHETSYFERCWSEQEAGNRVMFVAIKDEVVVGYIQLILKPVYQMFRKLGIPEIQDLNVIPNARRYGLGDALVAFCENYALTSGMTEVGIGVGLYKRYGSAQRLYVRRGYLPDGMGIVYDNQTVNCGDIRPVDDQLCLKFIKKLAQKSDEE